MSAYRLLQKQGSETFHRITHRRKWVGRVYQHADGTWIAAFGREDLGRGKTPGEAFGAAVSKKLGFSSEDALRAHNARVRRTKRFVNQAADAAFQRALAGNFDGLDSPDGLTLVLRGATRDLRRR